MASDTLNPRQRRFADLVAGGTAAAAAYTQVYGRSGRSAETASSRLMRNVEVRRVVAERRAGAARQVETDLAWVLRQLKLVAEDRDAPHAARVGALKAMATLHKDALVPTPILLQEAEPPSHERIAALAFGILESVAAGRLSPAQAEGLLSVAHGVAQTLLAAEAVRPDPKLIEAEGEPAAPEPPPVAWFKPSPPG